MRRMSECVLLYARSLTHSSRYSHLAYAQSLTTTTERETHNMDPGMNGKNQGGEERKNDLAYMCGQAVVLVFTFVVCWALVIGLIKLTLTLFGI